MIIYAIISKVDGKIYIGSSVNSLKRRWNQGHLCYLRRNCHKNRYLQYAWNKHGEKNFTVSIIENIKNKESLLEREDFWIEKLGTYKKNRGYNLIRKPTCNGGNAKLSENDVIKIIKLLEDDKLTRKQIVKKFKISESTLSDISYGRSWCYLKRKYIRKGIKTNINENFIKDVLMLYNEGKTQKQIAEMKHVNQSTICRIVLGKEKFKKRCKEDVYCAHI